MLATPDWQEPDEWNLHAGESTKSIPRSIADVESRAIPTHADQYESVQRKQVRDEDVTTPGRNHVSVEQRGQRTPEDGSILDSLDPKEERKNQQEDSNSFIVITPSDRARNVSGSNSHESGGKKPSGG
jgi:hypothetical protein